MWIVVALAVPLGILAAIGWGRGGAAVGIVVHGCARAWATAVSLPAVLALTLAGSIWGLALLHWSRQALAGQRALRLADRHAVAPPPSILDTARRLGIRRLVVTADPERRAFCAGLIRPTVVVSDALIGSLRSAPLAAVLAHEAAHARNRDPLRQLFASAAARGLWIAPAARRAAEDQRLRLELAADEYATRIAGRRALAEALLGLHSQPPLRPTPAIAGSGTFLTMRIEALMAGAEPAQLIAKHPRRRSVIGLVLIALLILTVVASPSVGPNPILPMPMNVPGLAEMTLAWAFRAAAVALGWVVVRGWYTQRTSD